MIQYQVYRVRTQRKRFDHDKSFEKVFLFTVVRKSLKRSTTGASHSSHLDDALQHCVQPSSPDVLHSLVHESRHSSYLPNGLIRELDAHLPIREKAIA